VSDQLKAITLTEWETVSPGNRHELADCFLDSTAESRRIADSLNASRMLRLTELKDGLEISATSFVGRVRIGDLSITVLPKLKPISLLRLLRYAYGFRRLELISDVDQFVEQCGFEDLLVSQLNAEVQELLSRGLQKAYVQRFERLGSPRGRIDIQRLVLDGGAVTATLPCQHFRRLEDTFLNQVLLAGLNFASTVASLVQIRRESKRLVSFMEDRVSRINLDLRTLEQAASRITRLSNSYLPAISIIRMLLESRGIVLEGKRQVAGIPGFLFDMNAFFQALISRFLGDNLLDCVVREEHALQGMMRYNPQFNPLYRLSPTPRPDFAVNRQGKLVALLDAKYRDLWEKKLPREMLYQLVVYAISNPSRPQSSILYPTLTPLAKEARIDVTDPVYGKQLGQVCLRPVNLLGLESLITRNTAASRTKRKRLAQYLAFGG
jgi:5-methylcytosine-specific restriction enzyme subunit McrC